MYLCFFYRILIIINSIFFNLSASHWSPRKWKSLSTQKSSVFRLKEFNIKGCRVLGSKLWTQIKEPNLTVSRQVPYKVDFIESTIHHLFANFGGWQGLNM